MIEVMFLCKSVARLALGKRGENEYDKDKKVLWKKRLLELAYLSQVLLLHKKHPTDLLCNSGLKLKGGFMVTVNIDL